MARAGAPSPPSSRSGSAANLTRVATEPVQVDQILDHADARGEEGVVRGPLLRRDGAAAPGDEIAHRLVGRVVVPDGLGPAGHEPPTGREARPGRLRPERERLPRPPARPVGPEERRCRPAAHAGLAPRGRPPRPPCSRPTWVRSTTAASPTQVSIGIRSTVVPPGMKWLNPSQWVKPCPGIARRLERKGCDAIFETPRAG